MLCPLGRPPLVVALLGCLASSVLGASVRGRTAGWVYIADGPEETWGDFPESWLDIPFDEIDILLVGPLGLQRCDWTPHKEANFPWHLIYRCQKDAWEDGSWGVNASLLTRFEKLLETARQKNSNLEVLVAQWWSDDVMQPLVSWGGNLGALGNSSDQLQGYARAVKAFIDKYNLDGYVLDYEATNVVSWYPDLLRSLRTAFRVGPGPSPKIAISPAVNSYLLGTNEMTDYVFLQSYASKVQTSDFLTVFDAPKLFFGLCPEGCSDFTAQAAAFQVKSFALGGIHAWRLNSFNASLMKHEKDIIRQSREALDGAATGSKASPVTQEQKEVAEAAKAAAAAFSPVSDNLPEKAPPNVEEAKWKGGFGDPRQDQQGPPPADMQGAKTAAQWAGMRGLQLPADQKESGFFNLIDSIHGAVQRRLEYV